MCTRTTASHSASSMLKSMRSRRIPALLTRMSRVPYLSIAVCTKRRAPSQSATSSVFATASPPSAVISSTTVCAGPSVGATAVDGAAEVVDDDLGALRGQFQRVAPPDPTSRARDNCDAPFTDHVFPSTSGPCSWVDPGTSTPARRRCRRCPRAVSTSQSLSSRNLAALRPEIDLHRHDVPRSPWRCTPLPAAEHERHPSAQRAARAPAPRGSIGPDSTTATASHTRSRRGRAGALHRRRLCAHRRRTGTPRPRVAVTRARTGAGCGRRKVTSMPHARPCRPRLRRARNRRRCSSCARPRATR